MTVTIRYQALLRRAAGTDMETLEAPDGSRVLGLLRLLGDRHGEPLRRLLLDDQDRPSNSLLVFLGDQQIPADGSDPLPDRAELTLLSPIAGGQEGAAPCR